MVSSYRVDTSVIDRHPWQKECLPTLKCVCVCVCVWGGEGGVGEGGGGGNNFYSNGHM